MTREEIHAYYSTKIFCRLDLDKFDDSYANSIPSTHPQIKFELFIKDIKERNRLQEILVQIKKHNSFEFARRIHSCRRVTLRDIIGDVESRIKKCEMKIEEFHKLYSI